MKKKSMLTRVELGLTGIGFSTAVGGMVVAALTDNYHLHRKSFGLGLIMMSGSIILKGLEYLVTDGTEE